MGDRGPTATVERLVANAIHANFSRWEIGGQPQLPIHVGGGPSTVHILADGRSGANRNMMSSWIGLAYAKVILADGRSGANRN